MGYSPWSQTVEILMDPILGISFRHTTPSLELQPNFTTAEIGQSICQHLRPATTEIQRTVTTAGEQKWKTV